MALVAVAAVVITGAAVRLTGSGLGCPDWPACTRASYVAPISIHPLIEFGNRVFTVLVTVAVAVALLGAVARRPRRRDLLWLSAGLVAGVLAQVVLGGLVVLFKLAPSLVAAHFLLSMAIVADAVVLHHRSGCTGAAATPTVSRPTLLLGRLVLAWTCVVLAAGTVATGSGPHSGNAGARRFPVHFSAAAELHATLAVGLIGLTLAAVVTLQQGGVPPPLARRGRELLAALAAQAAIGYAQYFTHVPAALVEVHILGATLILVAAVRLNVAMYHRPPPVAAPEPVEGAMVSA